MIEQPKPSSALERDLRHFQAQAQATVNDPALRAEHLLWVQLAATVEEYLRPASGDLAKVEQLFFDDTP